jgi:hypothetical protein
MNQQRPAAESAPRNHTGMDEILVSVVIPTFNRAAVIGDAIDSVLCQGVPEIEVLVVDDGSTDATAAALAGYDGRIRYLRQEHQGAGAARNHGIALARGAFVSFLDSDDVWMAGKTAAELALFARLPRVDAVISDSELWDEGRLVIPSRFAERGVELPAGGELVVPSDWPPLWARYSLFSTCCLTIRRAALARLGEPPFDPALRNHEDWDLELRMFHLCTVAVLPQRLASVRRFRDGTRAGRGSERDQLRMRYQVLCRARGLPPLSRQATREMRAQRAAAARLLAASAVGRQRADCLALAAAELRYGAWLNTLRVLAAAARPARATL